MRQGDTKKNSRPLFFFFQTVRGWLQVGWSGDTTCHDLSLAVAFTICEYEQLYASSLVKQLPTEVLKRLLMRPALKSIRAVSTPMDKITTNRNTKAAIGVGTAAAVAAGGAYAYHTWKDDIPRTLNKTIETAAKAKAWVKSLF